MHQMNRHQRRATKRALTASYAAPHNGVAHADLTGASYVTLKSNLERFGNVLSPAHETALFALCGLFTKSAQHLLPGRWAFGLPTGMGKTTAIIAWCATLAKLGLDHISVAVSASKIDAL